MNYNDRYVNETEERKKRLIVEIKPCDLQDLAAEKLEEEKKSKVMFQSWEFGNIIMQFMIMGKLKGSCHMEKKIMTFSPIYIKYNILVCHPLI